MGVSKRFFPADLSKAAVVWGTRLNPSPLQTVLPSTRGRGGHVAVPLTPPPPGFV
jgi:hypothetical protein